MRVRPRPFCILELSSDLRIKNSFPGSFSEDASSQKSSKVQGDIFLNKRFSNFRICKSDFVQVAELQILLRAIEASSLG